MTFPVFKSYKLHFDVLYKINPRITQIPYQNDRYNTERIRLKRQLLMEDSRYRDFPIDAKPDLEAWKKAEEERPKNRGTVITWEENEQINEEVRELPEKMYHALLCNLRDLLLAEPELEKMIGTALFYHIQSNQRDNGVIRVLYNKVTSVLDQRRIVYS